MPKKKPAKTTAKPAAPVGRPATYDPGFAAQAMTLCQLGATDAEMADFFDVSLRTLNRWKVTYDDFAEALRRGKEAADNRVEDSLYHRALGYEYEEARPVKLKKVNFGKDGKKTSEEEFVQTVMVKKVIPADTTAMIFWLKNRRSRVWRDIQQHEHGAPGDFARMSDEELDAHIKELQGNEAEATRH